MNSIIINNLHFAYNKQEPLIYCSSLKLESGNIYALVGANGSGKTTFLKLLLGLLKPTTGEIKGIAGHKIGFVPDYNGLYDTLTVLENIKIRLALYGCNYLKEESRICKLIEKYSLTSAKNTLVKNLSLGMKKKAAIICAIATKPSLLVLDEPTGGIDKAAHKELSIMLKDYLAPNTMILCTSHDLDFLDTLPLLTINFPLGETK